MSLLHMDSDEVRNIAWELSQLISMLQAELPLLVNAANALEANAPDPHTLNLVNELRAILDVCKEVATEGDTLSLRLSKEAAKWETADQDSAREFNGVCAVLGPIAEKDLVAVMPKVRPAPPAAPAAEPASASIPAGHTAGDAAAAQPPDSATPPTELPAPDIAAGIAAAQPALVPREEGWMHRVNNLSRIDKEIREFESRSSSSLSPEEARHLNQLYAERGDLREAVNAGITDARPGPNNFPEGQCTWYVASRRSVGYDIHGDARVWGDAAVNAGYEVGDVPVKGAIMVWQPGVHNADETYGHVSYIERVIPNSNGTFTVEFTDNLNMNQDAPTRITITPGEEGVQFIYDQTG